VVVVSATGKRVLSEKRSKGSRAGRAGLAGLAGPPLRGGDVATMPTRPVCRITLWPSGASGCLPTSNAQFPFDDPLSSVLPLSAVRCVWLCCARPLAEQPSHPKTRFGGHTHPLTPTHHTPVAAAQPHSSSAREPCQAPLTVDRDMPLATARPFPMYCQFAVAMPSHPLARVLAVVLAACWPAIPTTRSLNFPLMSV